MSKRTLGLGIAGVLTLAILVGCGGGSSSPGAVVKEFFILIHRGDTDKALEYVVSGSESAAIVTMMGEAMQMQQPLGGMRLTEVAIEREDVRTNEATVRCRLEYSMPTPTGKMNISMITTVQLTRSQGQWKINYVSPFVPRL